MNQTSINNKSISLAFLSPSYVMALILTMLTFFTHASPGWIQIDNFEGHTGLKGWTLKDTKNETQPLVKKPQVTVLKKSRSGNQYLLKKPAPDGIVGNRKALTFKKLPVSVAVGETYTFYSRINVEQFPNNHAFGVSNLPPDGIIKQDYNAFEATLRVTDKMESNGLINRGALMVKTPQGYADVINPTTRLPSEKLTTDIWYQIWWVVNNEKKSAGGQRYDVYLQGGEFTEQTKVYTNATFRMQRELPLIYFLMNCNTGPHKQPYGNGGLRYDDLYMHKGTNLNQP